MSFMNMVDIQSNDTFGETKGAQFFELTVYVKFQLPLKIPHPFPNLFEFLIDCIHFFFPLTFLFFRKDLH